MAPCGAHSQLQLALGSTVGPVEGALHACCFITSPPQPWRAGLPNRPWYPDGGPEAQRGWAWPPVGAGLRFEHGSWPLRAQVESEPRHRGAVVIPGWRCSLHSAPSSSCSDVRVPSLGPGSWLHGLWASPTLPLVCGAEPSLL